MPTATTRRSIFVAILEKDRQYGGPEEGGWWYDTGTVVKKIRAASHRQVPNAVKQAETWIKNQGTPRHGVGSVIYRGGEYEVQVCEPGERPSDYPRRRPHYE